MYKSPPKFTTGQELATRYWWNITQLAAAASQDIFLIVYSSMDGTDNGTKSIATYCLENERRHVTKELIEEGYDKEKLTANPSEVFFDLQLTRKVMDKVLVEDENRGILEKIRKKIRWLTYQRNEVCHEMLTSLELLNLKLKLGTLKGVLRQLYNLASQFSKINKETTDAALEFFLDELDVHRSVTTVTQYKSQRRFRQRHKRRFVESAEGSSDDDDDGDDDEDSEEINSNNSEDQWPARKDRNSFALESENNSELSDMEETKIGSHDLTNKLCKRNEFLLNNNRNGYVMGAPWETGELDIYSAEENTQRNSEHQTTSYTNPHTEGTFQEIWQAQGSTICVQIGLYCSKGWQNQFGNFQTVLPTGEQLMLFWQQCQCDGHLTKDMPRKVQFTPPKVDIRTRSKSLGRKASRYILYRQRLGRRKYRSRREKSSQAKRNLWNILDQTELCVPEIQKGVFGNKWEDIIRREEAIVAIENWDILIAEEEWDNEGWIDIQDLRVSSSSREEENQTTEESAKEQGSAHYSGGSELLSSEILDCYNMKTKRIFFTSASIISLISVLAVSSGMFVIVAAFLVAGLIGKALTELVNVLAVILLLCNLGCVVFIVFLIVKFLLVVLVSVIKVASVFLYFIRFCAVLEQRSSEAVQRMDRMARQ
ncbi:uncharacterized protein [Macrobrachium rosenbergii]|uniref:uncharacterized protein n=1 Tax=Macrobrachium rosenbergii TaxID=79674 RepID=UPI0034D4B5E3